MEKIFSPFTQEIIEEVRFKKFEEVQKSFQVSSLAQENWANSSKDDRQPSLKNLIKLFLMKIILVRKFLATWEGQ